MHDIHAVIENLHVGLQDVEVEGGCQHATVAAPLVTGTQQEPIPCGAAVGSGQGQLLPWAPGLSPSPFPCRDSPSQGFRNL